MAKRSQKASKLRDKPGAASPTGTARALPDANHVLLLGSVVYLAILAGMVVFDSYAFVLKSAVIPFLPLAALLSLRLQSFVNDWAPFLGAIVGVMGSGLETRSKLLRRSPDPARRWS